MASSAIGATGALASLPAGSLVDFAGSAAPAGWLMCDGSAVSRTVYAQLFASVGTTYGVGDGSTTFNLPDFRGRFARYMDNMGTGAGAAGRDTARSLPANLGTTQDEATKRPSTAFTVAATGDKNQFNSNQTAHSHGTSITLVGASNATTYATPATGTTAYLANQRAAGTAASNSGISTSSISWASSNFSTSGSVNGGGDTETRPINLSCNRIIKY